MRKSYFDGYKNEAQIKLLTAALLKEIVKLCTTGAATVTIDLDRDQDRDAVPHRYSVGGSGLPGGRVRQMFGGRSVRQLTGVLGWVARNNGVVTLTVHDTPGLYGGSASWRLFAGCSQNLSFDFKIR